MEVKETKLKGCFVLEPKVFEDKRGYFVESFNLNTFNTKLNLDIKFVQDNESKSSKGVLRGLHYQLGEYAQAKLVRVVKGSVLDVAVDVRTGSKTFGEYVAVKLTGENKKQLFVPRGFAHGFLVLEDHTVFSYKCDNFYNKASEGGVVFNDNEIGIDWGIPENELIILDKDITLPKLKDARL